MNKTDIVVAAYDSHEQVEATVRALVKGGFDMKTISVVGKDYHTEEHVVGYFSVGNRTKCFGKLGSFWGSLAGLLLGSALMFVPVVGHVVVLGPFVETLADGLEGVVLGGGAGALVGALSALGIPKDSVLRYEAAIKADQFLVIVHGGTDDVRRGRKVLAAAGGVGAWIHFAA
jgi:uncharacterized membrane protein